MYCWGVNLSDCGVVGTEISMKDSLGGTSLNPAIYLA